MSGILDKHGLSFAETHGLSEDGVLSTVHQHWFERTSNGDGRLIILTFASRIGSNALSGSCVSLFDGYVARVGAEYLNEDEGLDEYNVYLLGRRTVRAHIESTDPKGITINGIIDALKTGYQADNLTELIEQFQNGNDNGGDHMSELNGNGQPASEPARPKGKPRIQRAERACRKNPVPISREEALDGANQKRIKQAEIRTDLREGKIGLQEALGSPYLDRVAIGDILIRVPMVGEVKAGSALKKLGLAEETEIGTLTEEQKAQLAKKFPKEKHQPSKRKATVNRAQAMRSMRKANAVKKHRAALKVSLAAGEITVEDLFEDPIGSGMKIKELLVKLPTRRDTPPEGVRSSSLRDLVLMETGLPGSKRCSALTQRQRQALLDCLAGRYNEELGTYSYRKNK